MNFYPQSKVLQNMIIVRNLNFWEVQKFYPPKFGPPKFLPPPPPIENALI